MFERTPNDERSLIERARLGDAAALESLVERYEVEVGRISRAICIDADNADDVRQDTLLALVKSLGSFRGDATLSSWLFAVARHACLKRRLRSRRGPSMVSSLDGVAGGLDRLAAEDVGPEAEVANAELLRLLRLAIHALEPAQRDVLILRDVTGASADETARALGLSVSAVKSRLHRARLNVRVAMQHIA